MAPTWLWNNHRDMTLIAAQSPSSVWSEARTSWPPDGGGSRTIDILIREGTR
jgi:hypothetical protein